MINDSICTGFQWYLYAPVKVNRGGGGLPGQPKDSDIGTSDFTGDSDNSNSVQHHFDIILRLQMVEM